MSDLKKTRRDLLEDALGMIDDNLLSRVYAARQTTDTAPRGIVLFGRRIPVFLASVIAVSILVVCVAAIPGVIRLLGLLPELPLPSVGGTTDSETEHTTPETPSESTADTDAETTLETDLPPAEPGGLTEAYDWTFVKATNGNATLYADSPIGIRLTLIATITPDAHTTDDPAFAAAAISAEDENMLRMVGQYYLSYLSKDPAIYYGMSHPAFLNTLTTNFERRFDGRTPEDIFTQARNFSRQQIGVDEFTVRVTLPSLQSCKLQEEDQWLTIKDHGISSLRLGLDKTLFTDWWVIPLSAEVWIGDAFRPIRYPMDERLDMYLYDGEPYLYLGEDTSDDFSAKFYNSFANHYGNPPPVEVQSYAGVVTEICGSYVLIGKDAFLVDTGSAFADCAVGDKVFIEAYPHVYTARYNAMPADDNVVSLYKALSLKKEMPVAGASFSIGYRQEDPNEFTLAVSGNTTHSLSGEIRLTLSHGLLEGASAYDVELVNSFELAVANDADDKHLIASYSFEQLKGGDFDWTLTDGVLTFDQNQTISLPLSLFSADTGCIRICFAGLRGTRLIKVPSVLFDYQKTDGMLILSPRDNAVVDCRENDVAFPASNP